MKVGIILPMNESDTPGASTWPRVQKLARYAETGGIDSLWVYDHLIFRFPDEDEDGIHEAWTLLAALAGATERAQLGTIVLATSFRNPAVLAKMAATADEIAGGRLILGLGCGWHKPEYDAFGFPFDNRVGRFEEAMQVIRPLVHGERVTFHGRWTHAEDAVLIPPPPRPARLPGHMPILVASKGERMLRLTARYADAWNTAWFGLPDERFATRRAGLLAACEAEGRDPATLDVTVGVTLDAEGETTRPGAAAALPPDLDAVVRALAAWRDEGVAHLQMDLRPVSEATIDLVLEAVERHRRS
jgi:probable F420-dependent oxidoreductase